MTNGAGISAWTLSGYGRPEDLVLRHSPVPLPPAGHVALAVEATALNPLDLKLIAGELRELMPVAFPFVPASDVCGRVVAVGSEVSNYAVGDRVVAFLPGGGGLASHVVVPVGPALASVPSHSAAGDVASLPVAGMTALELLRAVEPKPGATIAVIGATGGVGLFLCQLATRSGAKVTATAAGEDVSLVRASGAQEVIDYRHVSVVDELLRRKPSGVDAVVDLINQFDALLGSARAVRSGGRLVSTLIGPEPDAFPRGVTAIYVRLSPKPDDLAHLAGLLASGALRSNVSKSFAFAEAPQALAALRDGHVTGKIVVTH